MDDPRLQDDYEPAFDIDYEVGRQGELFVIDIVSSLKTDRIEVKTDEKFRSTGNIYVEYECLRRGLWMPSGLAVTKAEFWVFVLRVPSLAVVFSTDELKRLSRHYYRNGGRVSCDVGSHPTRGVAVPLAEAFSRKTRKESS